MSWAVGFDPTWQRDIGYGVPAICDQPSCAKIINRGLAFVCANSEPYGGDYGCGLYFCSEHLGDAGWGECDGWCEPHTEECEIEKCPHIFKDDPAYSPSADTPEWIMHKLTHESWQD